MKIKKKLVIVIILSAVFALTACTFPFNKHITVVFRYDDISEISDTAIEKDLISIFKDNDMGFTAGIIPFVFTGYQGDPAVDQSDAENLPLGQAKIEMITSAVQDGVIEVTMHGFSHQTIPAEGGHREFKDLEYNLQYEKISQGVTFLEKSLNVPVTTFIPPWNRYDQNTLKALNEIGFTVLSANQEGEPLGSSPLLFLPSTCELNELQETVIKARDSIDPNPIIVVLFHQFDILGNDVNIPLMDFAEFTALLDWLKAQDDVGVLSFQQTFTLYPNLNARRYELNWAIRNSKMIPPMLMELINPLMYQSPYSLIAIFSLFYLGVLVISGAVVFLIGKLFFTKSKELAWLARIITTLLLIFVIMYTFRGTKVGFRGATGVALFLGAAIGTWWSSLHVTNKTKH